MSLTWSDLLIQDFDQEQCRQWLEPWSWRVDGRVGPEFLNKFGSWFFRRPEGHVEMLDIFTGGIERVANSHEEFFQLVNDPPWQEVYLLSRLVYRLHEVGRIPGPKECYAIAPHPALGGPNPIDGDFIDPQAVMLMEIGLWQSLSAQMVGLATSDDH